MSRMGRLIALAVLGCCSAHASFAWVQVGAGEDLLDFVRLRCFGPLDSLVLDMGDAGLTRVELSLAQGEEMYWVKLPLTSRPFDTTRPDIQVPSDYGTAKWGGWVESEERDALWQDLPAGLKARPRPPVRPDAVHASPSSLALALATALLVVGLRSFPRRAFLLACALGAGGVWFVQVQGEPIPSQVRVLEGLGASDAVGTRWLLARSADEDLIVDTEFCLRLEGSGPGRLEWNVTLGDWGQTHRARLAGETLTSFFDLDPGTRRCTPEVNAWGSLDQVWTRSGDGTWVYHGAWALGAPLPPAARAASGQGHPDPPGWLTSGLPMGTAVLVALLGPDTWSGPEQEAGEVCWLRWVAWNTAGGH